MKQGDIIKINGIDLLILDIINDNPFVLAYNLDITTKFSNIDNNYKNSLLRDITEQWLKKNNFITLLRTIDLTTVSGDISYGIIRTLAAPLTFDEYRKYSQIIIPHIKHSFWTVTAWSSYPYPVCYVYYDGAANYTTYTSSSGLAPAFILDIEAMKQQIDLSNIPTKILLDEINKRLNEGL